MGDFEAFFEANHAKLFGTLCLVMGRAWEAEELMQETFLKVWERWGLVVSHPDPIGYMYRTAFNLHRNQLRSAWRRARRVLVPYPSVDPLAEVEDRDTLMRALLSITPRRRAAVVLMELLDMTSEEAAAILGVRPATVRALASQGRAGMKAQLEDVDG